MDRNVSFALAATGIAGAVAVILSAIDVGTGHDPMADPAASHAAMAAAFAKEEAAENAAMAEQATEEVDAAFGEPTLLRDEDEETNDSADDDMAGNDDMAATDSAAPPANSMSGSDQMGSADMDGWRGDAPSADMYGDTVSVIEQPAG